MNGVIVDTHAVIWYLLTSKKLSKTAEQVIDEAVTIGICSISLVEIIFLTEKGKIPQIALQRLQAAFSDPNCRWHVISLDAATALAITDIERDVIPEMPDRIIAATAKYLGVPLITRDTNIQASDVQTIW